ncbi:hypothetical protein M5G27_27785 [Pseudomonas shahriarae]|jgi:hypothetical protein|uniref:Uncharacterized protein n=1 Tax=Pseudomonas shahriarae TaxID=2745512 RepID=A0A9X4C6N2_9PSED|nr:MULTISPECIES: hypothetical protein [Pseudomonas]MDD1011276.1 hypothetical protein [Pseudomonas shahriarae]POA78657.1 hypothetical protein C1890_10010 [Pseudomonas sp. DP16D-R1]
MTRNILALPLILFSLVVGGVMTYSLFHIDTVEDVDLERLEVGQHIALKKKIGMVDYEATIYVKVADTAVGQLGVFQLNGVVEGLGSNMDGQAVDFVSTDKDCVGTNFQLIYRKSFADVIVQPGGIPRTCNLHGYLKDNRALTRVDQ